mgnify:FL=1
MSETNLFDEFNKAMIEVSRCAMEIQKQLTSKKILDGVADYLNAIYKINGKIVAQDVSNAFTVEIEEKEINIAKGGASHIKQPISNVISQTKKVLTEDLGKIFEMAICLLYEIEYDGKYKYSLEEANILKGRIYKLKNIFPHKIKHIAKNGNKYDFVSLENNTNLNAKTTKRNGKVCPQIIGQPSHKKFCEFFKIDKLFNLEQIKKYIEDNVAKLLEIYCLTTFNCPIIYYNNHKNLLLFIKLKEHIIWTKYIIIFSHIIKNKKWNESSSIIINNNTIGEFQIHNHRDCIKFRWSFEKLLDLFKDNFEIINL